jgi:hypothetical protein
MMISSSAAELFLGSARLWRVGFGILPKQSSCDGDNSVAQQKSSRRQNVIASTLEACAPRILPPIALWNR